MDPWRKLYRALGLFSVVVLLGTAGYLALGFTLLDAFYQTVTTVTTVGFTEVNEPFDERERAFTLIVVLAGVGTGIYSLTVLFETIVEGHVGNLFVRRKMNRSINELSGHVIVCGWGRVGRSIAATVAAAGRPLVVIERDPERAAHIGHPRVVGDATDDAVLFEAGIKRAAVLIAALNTDADNLFVTVSSRALRPDLAIVARAKVESAEEKLRRAGADRVVNPQRIGGARMAALALQPHVADFLDVVMHDANLEFRLREVSVPAGSPLDGSTLRGAHLRDRTGALVLALRSPDGHFDTNPGPGAILRANHVMIAIGTDAQLADLARLAAGTLDIVAPQGPEA